ncbi:MAG: hypothetical protein AB7K68_12775 [Bacteriovoracia bacterium]
MLKITVLYYGLLLAAPAFALDDTSFSCINRDLPNSEYTLKMISLDGGKSKLPLIEGTKYFREHIKIPDSAIVKKHFTGIGSISTVGDKTMVRLDDMEIDFDKNEMKYCKQ